MREPRAGDLVPSRLSHSRLVTPFRCARPASETLVASRESLERPISPAQMDQSRIGHGCVIEREPGQAGQPLEMLAGKLCVPDE